MLVQLGGEAQRAADADDEAETREEELDLQVFHHFESFTVS